MKFMTVDGQVLEAESLRHLAEVIWQSSFAQADTLEEWMRGSAKRAAMFDGSVIRTESPEAHVEDLLSRGYVTRIE